MLKAFRPDRLLAGAAQFVAAVFGDNFINVNELDLVKIVEVRGRARCGEEGENMRGWKVGRGNIEMEGELY